MNTQTPLINDDKLLLVFFLRGKLLLVGYENTDSISNMIDYCY